MNFKDIPRHAEHRIRHPHVYVPVLLAVLLVAAFMSWELRSFAWVVSLTDTAPTAHLRIRDTTARLRLDMETPAESGPWLTARMAPGAPGTGISLSDAHTCAQLKDASEDLPDGKLCGQYISPGEVGWRPIQIIRKWLGRNPGRLVVVLNTENDSELRLAIYSQLALDSATVISHPGHVRVNRINWSPKGKSIVWRSDFTDADHCHDQPASPSCLFARDLFLPGAEPAATGTEAILAKAIKAALPQIVDVMIAFFVLVDLGLLVLLSIWTVRMFRRKKAIEPGKIPYEEKYAHFRAVLEWLEVVGPALAFVLTVGALIVAFDPAILAERNIARFSEAISQAMVATFAGLVTRVLAFTTDRMVVASNRIEADEHGFAHPEEGIPSSSPPPPPATGVQGGNNG